MPPGHEYVPETLLQVQHLGHWPALPECHRLRPEMSLRYVMRLCHNCPIGQQFPLWVQDEQKQQLGVLQSPGQILL